MLLSQKGTWKRGICSYQLRLRVAASICI